MAALQFKANREKAAHFQYGFQYNNQSKNDMEKILIIEDEEDIVKGLIFGPLTCVFRIAIIESSEIHFQVRLSRGWQRIQPGRSFHHFPGHNA